MGSFCATLLGQVGAPPAPYGESRYATEEHWMVWEITQFLGDFGTLARGDTAALAEVEVSLPKPGAKGSDYTVGYGDHSAAISTKLGPWQPGTYQDWAKPLFPAGGEAKPLAVSDEALAGRLLTLDAKALRAEGERTSADLQANPASGQAHVQAALLLGTIALNEDAGAFTDTRIFLNRITAHLTAALVLGAADSDPGYQLAEAMRLTLCGQQVEALAALKAIDELGDETFRSWGLVLRLRNIADWREMEERALAGPEAVRREYFRTLCRVLTVDRAAEFWRKIGSPPDLAYRRIAMEADMGTALGDTFIAGIFEAELGEIEQLSAQLGEAPAPENPEWFVKFLDTPPGSPVQRGSVGGSAAFQVQVAGRNLLAGLAQRRLMHSMSEFHHYLRQVKRDTAKADEFRSFISTSFPELRYQPFLWRFVTTDFHEMLVAISACGSVLLAHPELAPNTLWVPRVMGRRGDIVPRGADTRTWFAPPIPVGTVFMADSRVPDLELAKLAEPALVRALYEAAPHSYQVAILMARLESTGAVADQSPPGYIGTLNEPVDPALLRRYLGELLHYDLRAMQELAQNVQVDPAAYEVAMQPILKFNPNAHADMAQFYQRQRNVEKALEHSLLAFEKGTDPAALNMIAQNLVRHLYASGEREKAEQVAMAAAETGSAQGLSTYLWLLEQKEDWVRGLELARRLDQEFYQDRPLRAYPLLQRLHREDPERALELGFEEVQRRYMEMIRQQQEQARQQQQQLQLQQQAPAP